jgi:hypothetical protein
VTSPQDTPDPEEEESLLSEQSREDTDIGWGEYAASDDERLERDRPPHWEDFCQAPRTAR